MLRRVVGEFNAFKHITRALVSSCSPFKVVNSQKDWCWFLILEATSHVVEKVPLLGLWDF
jgi:hypothetical protein